MTTKFIFADFGNADADGAVRLTAAGTLQNLADLGIELREGLALHLSDGELRAVGEVSFRTGIWVAMITKWFPNDEESS